MDNIQLLISKYLQKGILVDTNILLLFFVGLTNPDRISRFKRTQQFVGEDYELLIQILNKFPRVITTPNILTEVNSMLGQLGEPERSSAFLVLRQFLATGSRFEECYVPSSQVIEQENFVRFGLTDCGISEVSRDRYLILTDDLRLANTLQSQGIDAINFNNIRTLNW
jgi:rRNA-processing protein FCF1